MGLGTSEGVGSGVDGGAGPLGAAEVTGELVTGTGIVAAMLACGLPPVPLAGVVRGIPGQVAGTPR